MARPKSRYVPALDGMRALAVLAVIAYHMNMSWAPGGLLGVTMFFVLSGYLITGLLVSEFDYSGTIDLKDFWMRRIRRIIPAVVTCVIVTAALCVIFNQALLTKMRPDMIPTLLFVNNWWQIFHNVSYFANLGAPSPLTHCWSLSIEEQFYVVWPILLLIVMRAGVRKSTIRKGIVVLICASALAMIILFDPAGDPSRVYYGTDTRVFSLLIGALLAFIWPYAKINENAAENMSREGRLVFNAVGIVALVALILMIAFTNGYSAFIYRGGLVICSLLTAVLMAVLVHPACVLSRVFALRPLVWIGKVSYGMYLWHYPLILLMTPGNMSADAPWWLRIIQLVVIFAVSAASYYLVENPIRHGAIGAWFADLKNGEFSIGTWATSHIAPLIVGIAIVAVALVGCAVVPDTSALEGGELLQNEEAQTNVDPVEESAEEAVVVEPYDIVWIGDSVSVRCIHAFNEVFPFGLIDAKVNRSIWEAVDVYDPYFKEGLIGNVVVFALGTNNAAVDEQIDDIMKDVGTEKRVFFVTTRSTTDWMEATNDVLWNASSRYDNVSIIDWYSASANHDEYFDGDGTHLTAEGARVYVNLVYQATNGLLPQRTAEEKEAKRIASAPDADEDGLDDVYGTAIIDADDNGVPDDTNNNGIPDSVEEQRAMAAADTTSENTASSGNSESQNG